MDCSNGYPYHKVYMYDKLNRNMLYILQKSKNSVIIHIFNGRDSVMQLTVDELEQELLENNLIVGEATTLELLYGKRKTASW